jgi:hypothetical protein
MILPQIETPVERRQIALEYQATVLRQARQFTQAMDLPAQPPGTVRLLLVAGDAVSTRQTAKINSSGSLEMTGFGPGDGVYGQHTSLFT